MGSSASDWAALDAMLASSAEEQQQLQQPATSYGRDGPVKVTGPSPGMIGPPKVTASKAPPSKPKKAADPNAIWSETEVLEAGDVDDMVDDGRTQPEYDLVFKQNVTPEDMYLGVDPLRNPGVACSDELVLKVKLPETKLADIDLDVRPTFVRLGAPRDKLKVHLAERVDENKGNAKVCALRACVAWPPRAATRQPAWAPTTSIPPLEEGTPYLTLVRACGAMRFLRSGTRRRRCSQ